MAVPPRLLVERAKSGIDPRARARARLVNVVVDGPQVGNSVPAVWEVTSPKLAIVRMHGRNHRTWNKKGLKAATLVAELSKVVPVVHAVMNNNYGGRGPAQCEDPDQLLTAAPKAAADP